MAGRKVEVAAPTDAPGRSPTPPPPTEDQQAQLAQLLTLLPALRKSVQSGELDDTLRVMECRQKYLKWSKLPQYIILLRHGQSEGNVNQTIYTMKGDAQLELTPKGMEQARQAGKRLAGVVGDRNVFVAVSPFERAVQTLYGLFEGGFPRDQVGVLHHDPRLREQEFGNFQSIGLSAAVKAEMKAVGRFYYRRPNAESSADVFDRISAFWEALLSDGPTSLLQDRAQRFGACLLVTHGLTIRLLLMVIFQWSVDTFESVFNIGNCEYVTLRRNADRCCYEFCEQHSFPSRLPWATRNVWVRQYKTEPSTPEIELLRIRIAKLQEMKETMPKAEWAAVDTVIDNLHLELHKLCVKPYTVIDYLNIKPPQTANKRGALRMAVAGHVRGAPDELLARPRFLNEGNEATLDLDDVDLDWWENVQSFKGRDLHLQHARSHVAGTLDTTPGGRAPLRRETMGDLGALTSTHVYVYSAATALREARRAPATGDANGTECLASIPRRSSEESVDTTRSFNRSASWAMQSRASLGADRDSGGTSPPKAVSPPAGAARTNEIDEEVH